MDTNKETAEYWNLYAQQVVGTLETNVHLKELTRNTALTGAYAESIVRSLTEKIVTPYSMSTGTIISPKLYKQHKLTLGLGEKAQGIFKQIDWIVWSSTPTPPIFESNDFALVPYQSVMGALEVKRSVYNTSVGAKMKATLDWVEQHTIGRISVQRDQSQAIKFVTETHWMGLGVICLRMKDSPKSKALDQLIAEGRAVVLLQELEDGSFKVNVTHVLHLINFLVECRKRVPTMIQQHGINVAQVGKLLNESPPGDLKKLK